MSVASEAISDEVLIEQLLQRQPQAQALLQRLQTRFDGKSGPGAFAQIEDGRCSACHLAVAMARLQQARSGLFITCANCSRFLYYPAGAGSTG